MDQKLSLKFAQRAASAATLGLLAACTAAASAAPIVMYRDAGCGCCLKWADHVENDIDRAITVNNETDMAARKTTLGVPPTLVSCHTAVIDGYVIEGHVPAADIKRLLETRPEGVKGLAVAGMPTGSPGMEYQNITQPYQVIAFGGGEQTVFANYN
ncbi:CopG protein [hydrothermal vent metagenome]|uniref:CopG protein n=1 Tax=hydrothermal vent metagenome TaxID=652676 RepID=A0A3B0R9B3_9ZZZZ